MPFTAEQHNVYGEPARLFFMDASMLHVPVHVLHRYVGASASMRAISRRRGYARPSLPTKAINTSARRKGSHAGTC
jgi:hypothetical protein